MTQDLRLIPARPDLAARSLKGQVQADAFADPVSMSVAVDRTPLREAPSPGASLSSELLYGEAFDVYEIREGWAWGQAPRDNYVGYVAAVALAQPGPAPTHRVIAARSFVYPGPSVKLPIEGALPMGALLAPVDQRDGYVYVPQLGWIWERHVGPIDFSEPDYVTVAERFLDVPYLWGGRTAFGCDCSGLVQAALNASGRDCPRDSDQQEAALTPIAGPWQRGDLVFWPGHVGIMRDKTNLLHANGYFMATISEPLDRAVKRMASAGINVRAYRRP